MQQRLLQVFVITDGGSNIKITLSDNATTPNPKTVDKETPLQAAQRLGKESPVASVDLGLGWNLDTVLVALALTGVPFKKNLKKDDLATRYDRIETADHLRYFMQQVLNGGTQVRLEPVPDASVRFGGAQSDGAEGGMFVG